MGIISKGLKPAADTATNVLRTSADSTVSAQINNNGTEEDNITLSVSSSDGIHEEARNVWPTAKVIKPGNYLNFGGLTIKSGEYLVFTSKTGGSNVFAHGVGGVV